jgi:hypothetical protein
MAKARKKNMVTVKNYSADGMCGFCTKAGAETFDCDFKDGLRSQLCRGCFTRALRARAAERKETPAESKAAAAGERQPAHHA